MNVEQTGRSGSHDRAKPHIVVARQVVDSQGKPIGIAVASDGSLDYRSSQERTLILVEPDLMKEN